MEVVQQDDEALVKLENTGIERSKAVDSAVLGKYSIWRRENENEKADSRVRLMRDQMIMARIYSVLAKSRDKLDLYQELLARLKESQRSLGEATADAELPKRWCLLELSRPKFSVLLISLSLLIHLFFNLQCFR
jgi:alpha-1,4-galacturonosyltransferase